VDTLAYVRPEQTALLMAKPPTKLVRERRRKIVDELLEVLTHPDGPTREEIEHFTLVVAYFGVHAEIDMILQSYCNTPELVTEMRIGIITYLLNSLIRNPEPAADPQS